jgi:hypothetical protein
MCGLDIEVPPIAWNSCPGKPRNAVGVFAARIWTPGAVMSGFSRSPVLRVLGSSGPRDENAAIVLPPPNSFEPPESDAFAPAPADVM